MSHAQSGSHNLTESNPAGLLDLLGGEALLSGLVELVLAQHPLVQIAVLAGVIGLFYVKVVGSVLTEFVKVVWHRSCGEGERPERER
ncbi:hypothetical protein [Nocardiopsis dassonvillei]|uniref:hypothetical protein n=1 Tax=Nocardiopsis dassonvillei TaxID=2014 RepID=UPI003F573522